ncbi:MAG: hypothetical protein LQ350_004405 [Teloschistes chrysophthalmus]|nr:MAG: hypothetical protein LQ350_004405 [Niorma chrysophthalma]
MPSESAQSSTSSYRGPQTSSTRQRNATRITAWQNPTAPEPPGWFISNRHGPSLEPEDLIIIADCFLEFDLISLELCALSFKTVIEKTNGEDPTDVNEAATNLQEIAAIREELVLIRSGRLEFHRDYLKSQVLVKYTGKSLSLFSRKWLDDPALQHDIMDGVVNMLSKIRNVPERLVVAAQQGLLDPEMRAALRRRWDKIEDVHYTASGRQKLPLGQKVSSWEVIMAKVNNGNSTAGNEKATGIVNDRMKWLNTCLWATFSSNICLTIPFLWKAYQFSPHTRGTPQDSDFWFLVQSSVSQSIGLLIAALGLWKLKSTPLWVWLSPTVMAAICNMLTMPLYLFAPTEWSSFCAVVAGAIQSFMILQLAIAGH